MFVGKTTAESFQVRQPTTLTAVYQVGLYQNTEVLIFLYLPEVKLIGGSGRHEGNILVGNQPVCDDGHNDQNALVVCRFIFK